MSLRGMALCAVLIAGADLGAAAPSYSKVTAGVVVCAGVVYVVYSGTNGESDGGSAKSTSSASSGSGLSGGLTHGRGAGGSVGGGLGRGHETAGDSPDAERLEIHWLKKWKMPKEA